ncbi:MAG: hypothetical protein U0163_04235 [Gemmatimonadaceae bacterium]
MFVVESVDMGHQLQPPVHVVAEDHLPGLVKDRPELLHQRHPGTTEVPLWSVDPRMAIVGVRVVASEPIHPVDADAIRRWQLLDVLPRLIQ